MTEVLFPIRGQLFGGFDRRDVISYISKANAEKQQTQQERDGALNEAEELRDKCSALEEELAELKAQLQAQTEETQRIIEEGESTVQELETAKTELTALRQELSAKRQTELAAAVDAVRELKESFTLVKGIVTSRTATLKKELTLADSELSSMNAVMTEAEGKINTILENITKEQNRIE